MTGIDKLPKEQVSPEKEEFFDAIRRHICQILGFDYGFVDLISGSEIINLTRFSAEENSLEAEQLMSELKDEHKQSLSLPNSTLAQKVRQTQSAWVGYAVGRSITSVTSDKNIEIEGSNSENSQDSKTTLGKSPYADLKTSSFESTLKSARASAKNASESTLGHYPYAIVPISANASAGSGQIKGLIRVICFESDRTISEQDLSTLHLMGEHLATKLPASELADKTSETSPNNGTINEYQNILVIHANRLVRRRFSRILSNQYNVIESDSSEKALEVLQQQNIDLIIVDNGISNNNGLPFCKVLRESDEWGHIPIILITPDNNPSAKIDGLNVGADDCLSESCLDLELSARVKSSLRHRKIERELAIQLQLLEDYAKRLEDAHEKLSKEKHSQIKRNHELELLRWESDILRNQENLLHRISNTIRRSFNIEGNLRETLEGLAGWFSLDSCFLIMPTPDEPEDSIRCEAYTQEDYQVRGYDVDLKTLHTFQKHCQIEQALIVNDVENDRRLDPFRTEALSRHHALSLFYIPITYEQKLLGLLAGIKCESVANWTRDNEAFLRSVADQIATGVTNARLYARVQRQATTDGLTGLFNHRTGQEKLSEQLRLAERYQRNVAIIMIDVDHFKVINDTYGHPAGDSVLKAVAKSVQRDCRDVDLPVRYGGEEFLLVLPEVTSEGAVIVAERIRRNLAQQVIEHDDIKINVTASMGVAAFPEDAHGQQQLLDLADRALYLSKRLGRNRVHTASDLLYEEFNQTEPTSTPAIAAEVKIRSDFVPPPLPASIKNKEELVPEVVEMVKALAAALYSKSEYNKVHHIETARLSELLARVLGLSQQQIEQIRVAGLLHDVGTLSIPSDLVNKIGVFSPEERALMNQHPVLGAELLRPIRALKDICEILENHHERWDGTGYPRGLKGEEIPLASRIVSIVDSYHAMISDRPYRKALPPEQAMSELKAGAGYQWDPFLVDIFIAVLNSNKEGKQAAKAYLIQSES